MVAVPAEAELRKLTAPNMAVLARLSMIACAAVLFSMKVRLPPSLSMTALAAVLLSSKRTE